MPGLPVIRTETKEERKRMTTTKQYTSNSSNLVEKVTPQILFLDTKPFVIFTDVLFQVDSFVFFKKKCLIVFLLCSGMKLEFLFSTGIKWQSSVLFWT